MLFSEMSHGMSQIGVPHFTHAMHNAVCDGVDAEAHKMFNSRHVHGCCCESAAYYAEDWCDHFEDETLFVCLFDSMGNSEKLNDAHAGVAIIENARNDNPRCSYETGVSTNSDNLQTDQGYKHSTSKLCSEVSQQTGGSGQSTSSCAETEECLDITQEIFA